MKKNIVVLLIIMSLVGCSTMNDLISGLPYTDGETKQGDSGESEMVSDEKEETQSDSSSMANLDMSAFLSPDLQFSLYYASYFFLGGYGFGDENFRDGEGVKWSVFTNSDTNEIIITRARLKTFENGSAWWYFSTEIDDSEFFYEILMENDYDLLKVRYANSQTGVYEEFIPEGSQGSREDVETLNSDVYNSFIVGSESLKTRAGTFKTDHIVLEQPGEDFKYEYWIADRAPGHIVKYRYENKAENQIMDGEIIDIRGGYKTKLNSY